MFHISYTLDGNNLGKVLEENPVKMSFSTPMPVYGSDSSATYIFDYGGAQRTINLTGRYAGTLVQIQVFITAMEGLLQGAQDTMHGYPKVYNSDLIGAVNVKIAKFDYTYYAGDPGQLYYTLQLYEANTGA